MLKRLISIVVGTLIALSFYVSSADALELAEKDRTVKANPEGDSVVISLKDAQKGQRLFNDSCSQCHAGGRTKTNPNVGLALDVLEGAEPPRDSIATLVDYMKNPTTYDGEEEITLLHPNTQRADIYPEMRNLTEDDLEAIAAHILIQPKIRGVMWGGGKVYN